MRTVSFMRDSTDRTRSEKMAKMGFKTAQMRTDAAENAQMRTAPLKTKKIIAEQITSPAAFQQTTRTTRESLSSLVSCRITQPNLLP